MPRIIPSLHHKKSARDETQSVQDHSLHRLSMGHISPLGIDDLINKVFDFKGIKDS